MDIHDIPIAKVTEQYLDYLHQLEKLDIDVSGDFIYMAATLIHIKSKMLLPADPLAGPDAQDDPRDELVHRLLEHEKFKNAAQFLYQKQQIESARLVAPGPHSLYRATRWKANWSSRLLIWCKTFQQVLERRKEVTEIRAAPRQRHHRANDGSSAPTPDGHGRTHFPDRLFRNLRDAQCHDRRSAGGSRNGAHAGRDLGSVELFADIALRKHKMFDAVFAGPDAMSKIEEQYL